MTQAVDVLLNVIRETNLCLQSIVGRWSNGLVDMRKVHDILQEKASRIEFVQNSIKDSESKYGWDVLMMETIGDGERLADAVSKIYHISYNYMCGDSFVNETYFGDMFLSIGRSLLEMETSVYFVALWIGHMNCNANGKIIVGFSKVVNTLDTMFKVLKKSSQKFQARQLNIQQTSQNTLLKKIGSDSKKLYSKVPKILNVLKFTKSSPKSNYATEFKESANNFVLSMEMFLNILSQADILASGSVKEKSIEEIEILEKLFGLIYGVSVRMSCNPATLERRRPNFDYPKRASFSPNVGTYDVPVTTLDTPVTTESLGMVKSMEELEKKFENTSITGKQILSDPENILTSADTLGQFSLPRSTSESKNLPDFQDPNMFSACTVSNLMLSTNVQNINESSDIKPDITGTAESKRPVSISKRRNLPFRVTRRSSVDYASITNLHLNKPPAGHLTNYALFERHLNAAEELSRKTRNSFTEHS